MADVYYDSWLDEKQRREIAEELVARLKAESKEDLQAQIQELERQVAVWKSEAEHWRRGALVLQAAQKEKRE